MRKSQSTVTEPGCALEGRKGTQRCPHGMVSIISHDVKKYLSFQPRCIYQCCYTHLVLPGNHGQLQRSDLLWTAECAQNFKHTAFSSTREVLVLQVTVAKRSASAQPDGAQGARSVGCARLGENELRGRKDDDPGRQAERAAACALGAAGQLVPDVMHAAPARHRVPAQPGSCYRVGRADLLH